MKSTEDNPTSSMTRKELVAEAVNNSVKVSIEFSDDPNSSGRFLTIGQAESKSNSWLAMFVETSRRVLGRKERQVA